MQQLPTHRPPDHRRPTIEVMPHLSAPIDEGPLLPRPGWRWWDKALLGALVIGATVAVLAIAFLRATALR